MVAVHFEERCAYDDDYGKSRDVFIFDSQEDAQDYLLGHGAKRVSNTKYIYTDYHSEVHATIHNAVRKSLTTLRME